MGLFQAVFHTPTEEEKARREFFDRFSKESMDHSTWSQLEANREQLYDMFAHDTWTRLDPATKRSAIQALENDFAYQEGRPAKKVEITSLKDGQYGGWSPKADKIFLNENLVNNGSLYHDKYAQPMPDANMQIFDTIAHEGHHAYQSYALEHPEIHADKEQLRSWALNTGLYYDHGNEYLIQPMERDAWRFGYEKTTEAFRGIEERNGREPGREDYELTAQQNSYDLALQEAELREANILDHMEEEMQEACDQKGIFYDYAPRGEQQDAAAAPEEDVQETLNQGQQEDPRLGGLWTADESEQEAAGENQAADLFGEKEADELETLDLDEGQEQAEGQAQSAPVAQEEDELETLDLDEDQDQTESQAQDASGEQEADELEMLDLDEDQHQTEDQTLDASGEQEADELEMLDLDEGQEQQTPEETENEDLSMDQLAEESPAPAQDESEDLSMDQLAEESPAPAQDESEDLSMDQLAEESPAPAQDESEDLSMDQLAEESPAPAQDESADLSMDQLAGPAPEPEAEPAEQGSSESEEEGQSNDYRM